jgi:hypothetical protein
MSHAETSDLLWGVDEIAGAIGRDRSAVYYLLSKGDLPAKKVGGRWVASKRRLLAFLTGEAGAVA